MSGARSDAALRCDAQVSAPFKLGRGPGTAVFRCKIRAQAVRLLPTWPASERQSPGLSRSFSVRRRRLRVKCGPGRGLQNRGAEGQRFQAGRTQAWTLQVQRAWWAWLVREGGGAPPGTGTPVAPDSDPGDGYGACPEKLMEPNVCVVFCIYIMFYG